VKKLDNYVKKIIIYFFLTDELFCFFSSFFSFFQFLDADWRARDDAAGEGDRLLAHVRLSLLVAARGRLQRGREERAAGGGGQGLAAGAACAHLPADQARTYRERLACRHLRRFAVSDFFISRTQAMACG
jgi:hypothetical protein